MRQMDLNLPEKLQQTEEKKHLLDLLNILYHSNKQMSRKTQIKTNIGDIQVANLESNGHHTSLKIHLDHLDQCVGLRGFRDGKS